jgi:phosphoglycolate phosphatase
LKNKLLMNLLAANQLRAVLIDLDGTMIDSAPDIVEAANRMLGELGAPVLAAETVISFIGNGVPTLVQRLINASPMLALQDHNAASRIFYQHYNATNGQCGRVFPGVLTGLLTMQEAGLQLACVTNKPMSYARTLLQVFGLERYMRAVVAGDSLPQMKPSPEPLRYACEKLGVPCAKAVMVGDSQVDVAAARAVPMPVILVRYGYPGAGGPEFINREISIDSFDEIPTLLGFKT